MQQHPGVALVAELVLLQWQGQSPLQYASCCHRPPLPLQLSLMPDAATPAGRTPSSPALQAQPFSHSVYHIHACPSQGDTSFAPMMEVLQGTSAERRAKWSRLSMLSDRCGSAGVQQGGLSSLRTAADSGPAAAGETRQSTQWCVPTL